MCWGVRLKGSGRSAHTGCNAGSDTGHRLEAYATQTTGWKPMPHGSRVDAGSDTGSQGWEAYATKAGSLCHSKACVT